MTSCASWKKPSNAATRSLLSAPTFCSFNRKVAAHLAASLPH